MPTQSPWRIHKQPESVCCQFENCTLLILAWLFVGQRCREEGTPRNSSFLEFEPWSSADRNDYTDDKTRSEFKALPPLKDACIFDFLFFSSTRKRWSGILVELKFAWFLVLGVFSKGWVSRACKLNNEGFSLDCTCGATSMRKWIMRTWYQRVHHGPVVQSPIKLNPRLG